MKVKDLILELQKYKNQEAEINIISNFIDIDNDAFDKENCQIECCQQDVDNAESYDIYVYKENNSKEPKLHELLAENNKLMIYLDTKDKFSNIVIFDENENVLRDIQVDGRHNQEENISIILSNII